MDDARLLVEEQHAVHIVQTLTAGALDAQLVHSGEALRVVQLALRESADQSYTYIHGNTAITAEAVSMKRMSRHLSS